MTRGKRALCAAVVCLSWVHAAFGQEPRTQRTHRATTHATHTRAVRKDATKHTPVRVAAEHSALAVVRARASRDISSRAEPERERPASVRVETGDPDPVLRFEEAESSAQTAVSGRSKKVQRLDPREEKKDKKEKGKERVKEKIVERKARPCPPNASWRPYRREPWRRGYVSVVGHGKSWSGFLIGRHGEVLPAARAAISEALSSWRTGHEMLLDERLISLVADVSDEFGGRPIRIVSGYREFSYAPGSKHKSGQAFDFSIPGVPNEALRDFLRSLNDVGVGYYPNSTHVHLDVRDRNTYWVDFSAPGEHPLYAWQKAVRARAAARRPMTPHEREIAAALDAFIRESQQESRRTNQGASQKAPSPGALHDTRTGAAARVASRGEPGRAGVTTVSREDAELDDLAASLAERAELARPAAAVRALAASESGDGGAPRLVESPLNRTADQVAADAGAARTGDAPARAGDAGSARAPSDGTLPNL